MIISAFCKPINVMNKPIPAPTASFNSTGIAFINFSRSPVIVNSRKKKLEINTAANAYSQGSPCVKTTV